uniref:phosphatidylinositol 3,4,5-trisphosphate-dependent Rac exchanger 2 protein-like isoform X2 n=1 Tax=Myxine glutinosa TaxID=7769 RepID=UPI00358FD78A
MSREYEKASESAEGEELSEKQQRLRVCVMSEILSTERDYVGALEFLVSAFLHRMRQYAASKTDKHITEETIATLFCNVDNLLRLHQDFLHNIERCLHPSPDPSHRLGNCFLMFKDHFRIYEEYCSNHEKAQRLCVDLNKVAPVHAFFLGCMLLGGRRVNDIPLEGYLLSPIQRICKYPLLLKELVKRTPAGHEDGPASRKALACMKAVCSGINETKRRMEKLEVLQDLQQTIEGWEGSSITDTCTEMLKQGTLLKISAGNIQERVFFLFDNLLVYCKRKLRVGAGKGRRKSSVGRRPSLISMAGSNDCQYAFRGRINTEVMEVENVEDGTADFHSSGHTVTNGWKIHNTAKNKWFVCMAKSPEEKQEWLDAIVCERERRRSLKLGMERDAWMLITEKGEKLYHMTGLRPGLIRDRKKKMSTFPKCFLGSDFVTWLHEVGEIGNEDEGVNLGQALLENGIIHHVSDKHQFKNEPLLYRFRYDDGTFKPRNEMQDMIAKGVRVYCRLHSIFMPVIKDKDYHLKTHKSVIMANRLVDWLVSQGDCRSREEAVVLGAGLCNNGFMHHVLEKSEFKDEPLLFRFYADEESDLLGTPRKLSRPASQRVDFKVVENVIAKTLMIKPGPNGYGFDIEERGSQVLVKCVEKTSHAEMAGLRAGKKLYLIQGDAFFQRPSGEAQAFLQQCFRAHLLLRVLTAIKPRENISVLESGESLGFQIRSCAPSVVHAVGRGSAAASAGLQPGQCIIKVNGCNVAKAGQATVVGHLTSFRQRRHSMQEEPDWVYGSAESCSEAEREHERGGQLVIHNSLDAPCSPQQHLLGGTDLISELAESRLEEMEVMEESDGEFGDSTPVRPKRHSNKETNGTLGVPAGPSESVTLTVDNPHVEYGVAYEFESTAGTRCHVMEKMVEPSMLFLFTAKILEALARDDERLERSAARIRQSAEEWGEGACGPLTRFLNSQLQQLVRRIATYRKFARTLRTRAWPTFKAYKPKSGSLHASDFCATNCHLNVLEISYPQHSTSLGSSLGVRTERPRSLPGLGSTDAPDHGRKPNAMVYTHHCLCSMAAPCASPSIGSLGKTTEGRLLREGSREERAAFVQLNARLEDEMQFLKQSVQRLESLLSTPCEGQPGEELVGKAEAQSRIVKDGDTMEKADRMHNGDLLEPEKLERPRKVSFEVLKEEQEDSGHDTATSNRDSYSDCCSNRNSVMSFSSLCSSHRCSSILSDDVDSGEDSADNMSLENDKQDKIQGYREQLSNQMDFICQLLKGPIAGKAFDRTERFTPNFTFQDLLEELDQSSGCTRMDMQVAQDSVGLGAAFQSLEVLVEGVKKQLTLALLENTDVRQQAWRDTAFCQALGSTIAVFTEQLQAALSGAYRADREGRGEGSDLSRAWLEQLGMLGLLVCFRSLLSPSQVEECSMLQDTALAIKDLEKVSLVFHQEEKQLLVANVPMTYQVEGSRQAVQVIISLPASLFTRLPPRLQAGQRVPLHPVFFSQALEQTSVPSCHGSLSPIEIQHNINSCSYDKVRAFYHSLRSFYLDKAKLPSEPTAEVVMVDKLLRPLGALDELSHITEVLLDRKDQHTHWPEGTSSPGNATTGTTNSGAGLLSVTAELCDRLGACHVIVCNSGVHRCTLQVTMEQVMWLTRCHGLPPRSMMQAADVMRKQGARVQNTAKNLGVPDSTPLVVPRLYKLCRPDMDAE